MPARSAIGYLTPGELSTGGELKTSPEDFVVEELPAYLPGGAGEHLYLWIEKRDVSADFLLDQLARALNISRGDIGTAGIKDRRAVTRQWVSVPARCAALIPELAIDGVRVLESALHGNKLRTGHLVGNRFEIRLRGINDSATAVVPQLVEQLRTRGIPNLYGDQRFGIENQTLSLGLSILRGERSPRSIPYAKRKFLLRLALSAVQSALFNEALAERLRAGTIDKVQTGDVMQVVASGGCFVAEDPAVEQPRRDSGETVITGPMFGPRMKSPEGDVREFESGLLARWGFEAAAFEKFPDLTSGTRRPYLVPAGDLEATVDGDGLLLKFQLPAGAYATSVVREFLKGDRGFPCGP
ncbi:tRNA pseudouridine(13) synthase TruD [Caulifigura coniformis]|nr:tRNA pseudouridine(13) synthase TruD [Caulifigura coniformis]